MKKTPKIYQKEITRNIINNQTKCSLKNESSLKKETTDIEMFLKELFNEKRHVYNIKLNIKTKTGNYNTSIIAKNKYNVITIDNKIIPIKDIIDIKRT